MGFTAQPVQKQSSPRHSSGLGHRLLRVAVHAGAYPSERMLVVNIYDPAEKRSLANTIALFVMHKTRELHLIGYGRGFNQARRICRCKHAADAVGYYAEPRLRYIFF